MDTGGGVHDIPQANIVKILTNIVPRPEDELVSVLHEAAHDLGVVQNTFTAVLTYVLSSTKTGPGPTETMDALGKERSVARLRDREIIS